MQSVAPINQKPMTSPAEAQAVAAHLNEVMDALLTVVEQETDLVRAGKIADATRLDQAKNDLARLYVADTLHLSANRRFIESAQPALMKNLRQRHDTFHALLQINLTVLATAHAVAESLVRGVSAELTRKAAPQVYGASGRQAAPRGNTSVPLAMARSL
jgi:hypothetical protein